MVANSTSYTPFYEPGAPPPPLPLLTAQTDLFYNPLRPTALVNTEILPKGGLAPATHPARVTHAVPANQIMQQRHVKIPSNTRGPSPLSDITSSEHSLDSDASESSDSELSESDCSTDLDDTTIPKPPGEVGRPGRGGYTLELALDWNLKALKKLKVQ
jgi:hypothetical protein